MASNSNSTILYPSTGQGYTLYCGFSEETLTETQTSSNKTKINANGYLKANGTYWSTSYTSTLVLYWHDNKNNTDIEISRNAFAGFASSSDVKTVNASFEIEHKSDGTLSGYVWIQFNKGSTTSSYAPASGSVATGLTSLTTIPRATVCPNINGIVEGTSINIALNPASSSFTHSIQVKFNKLEGYLNEEGIIQDDEVILNITSPIINFGTEYYSQFDKSSYEGKIIVNTYNGDTLIGSKEGILNVSVDSNKCKPTATGTVKDINAVTVALTGDDNVIVKGYSTALITPTVTPSASKDAVATINKKYINGIEFSTATVTVNGALDKDFELSMTNSRNITGTSILSAESLLDYIKVSILAKFMRSSSTSTDMKVSLSGNFFDDYFDAAKTKKNKLNISWSVKVKGTDDDYTAGGTIISTNYTIKSNKITSEEIPLSNPLDSEGKWDPTLGYDFLIEYNDLLVSDSYKDSIKRGKPYCYWYVDESGENHFVVLDHLDVKGITKLLGDAYNGENKKFLVEGDVETGDTLPIGAIVDYDGSDVPEGYEEVANSSGSNSNGTWTKFADGTMIVNKTITGTADITSAWGSLYISTDINMGDFPIEFIERPTITVTPQPQTGTQFLLVGSGYGNCGTATNAGSVALVRPNSRTGVAYVLDVIAKGRWK